MKRLWLGALSAIVMTVLPVSVVLASHDGATVDCGPAGEFVARATPNAAGSESPPPHGVLLFEENASLTIFTMSIGGRTVWHGASVGATQNSLDEAECSFSLTNGLLFELTGILRT